MAILENKDKNGKEVGWWLPCGHVEADEDFIQCGIRETLEEAGIKVEVKGLLRVVVKFKKNLEMSSTVIIYAESTEDSTPKSQPDKHSQRS